MKLLTWSLERKRSCTWCIYSKQRGIPSLKFLKNRSSQWTPCDLKNSCRKKKKKLVQRKKQTTRWSLVSTRMTVSFLSWMDLRLDQGSHLTYLSSNFRVYLSMWQAQKKTQKVMWILKSSSRMASLNRMKTMETTTKSRWSTLMHTTRSRRKRRITSSTETQIISSDFYTL